MRNPLTSTPAVPLTPVQADSAPAVPQNGRLSVIIPTLNECPRIERTVASAWNAGADEVVVADGGSVDGTRRCAEAAARVVVAPPGRASQMNAGARAASGDVFLFLHADARLPEGAAAAVHAALAEPGVGGGAFRMRIDDPRPWFRAATVLAQARATLFNITLGDQAIFARRATFEAAGGYREMPILEDLDFVGRLRRRSRFRILRPEVASSARRWVTRGRWQTSIVNLAILFLYRAGVPAERLAWLYR